MKITTEGGVYPEIEEYQNIAVEKMHKEIAEKGLFLNPANKKLGMEKVKEKIEAEVNQLSKFHLEEILPKLNPVDEFSFEKEFYLKIPGLKFRIKGYIDLIEPGVIADLKVLGTTPACLNSEEKDKSKRKYQFTKSDQFVAYSMHYFSIYGEFPEVRQDNLIKNKVPVYRPAYGKCTKKDCETLIESMKLFEKKVNDPNSVYMPSTKGAWWCGFSGCSFSENCKFMYLS
jgi:hypothetical protein